MRRHDADVHLQAPDVVGSILLQSLGECGRDQLLQLLALAHVLRRGDEEHRHRRITGSDEAGNLRAFLFLEPRHQRQVLFQSQQDHAGLEVGEQRSIRADLRLDVFRCEHGPDVIPVPEVQLRGVVAAGPVLVRVEGAIGTRAKDGVEDLRLYVLTVSVKGVRKPDSGGPWGCGLTD